MLVFTVGCEILNTRYDTWTYHELKNLVAGDARLETFVLHFLSVYRSDLHSLCKKGPALPHVQDRNGVPSPLFKSFCLSEFRTALVSWLLSFNWSERQEMPLEMKRHVPCEARVLTTCSLEVSCTRTRFQKSFCRLTVNFWCLSTNL